MSAATNYAENAILDAIGNNVSFVVAQCYCKLHTGDPGEDAANNAAGETTRVAVSFAAASGGSMSNDAAVSWTGVSTTETYTHISLWDTIGPAGGNPILYGPMAAGVAVTAGDDFEFAIGNLTASLD